jgi:hypothetical protein
VRLRARSETVRLTAPIEVAAAIDGAAAVEEGEGLIGSTTPQPYAAAAAKRL